jgi:pimeloyl-ACP methyl ester carboxylesterase
MRTLDVGQATFSYLDQGRGTAVVLLHGIGSAARSFDRQIGALSPRHRVVVWDAPGYGSSTALAPASPTAADYAVALAEFLDALGRGAAKAPRSAAGRCCLAGASRDGRATGAAAARAGGGT